MHVLLHADDTLILSTKRNVTSCLKNGELCYKKQIVYLGLIISDTGIISKDINLNINSKKCNISVKFQTSVRETT